MQGMLKFALDRLKERSTWVGFIGLLTVAGVSLGSDQTEAIINAGIAVVSLIVMFTKDVAPAPAPTPKPVEPTKPDLI